MHVRCKYATSWLTEPLWLGSIHATRGCHRVLLPITGWLPSTHFQRRLPPPSLPPTLPPAHPPTRGMKGERQRAGVEGGSRRGLISGPVFNYYEAVKQQGVLEA
jgi:hypothetical protein